MPNHPEVEIEGAAGHRGSTRSILEDDARAAAIRAGLVPPPRHRPPPPAPSLDQRPGEGPDRELDEGRTVLGPVVPPERSPAGPAATGNRRPLRPGEPDRAAEWRHRLATGGLVSVGLATAALVVTAALLAAVDAAGNSRTRAEGPLVRAVPAAGTDQGETGAGGGAPPDDEPDEGATTDDDPEGTGPTARSGLPGPTSVPAGGADPSATGSDAGTEPDPDHAGGGPSDGRSPAADPGGVDGGGPGTAAGRPGDRTDGTDRSGTSVGVGRDGDGLPATTGPGGAGQTGPDRGDGGAGGDGSDTGSPGVSADPAGACFVPVLSETFDGTELDPAVWRVLDGDSPTGRGRLDPSALTVDDGVLTITAADDGAGVVSGALRHRHEQAYGRYEVRVRTSADPSESTSGVVLIGPASVADRNEGENRIYETLIEPGDRSRFHSFLRPPGAAAGRHDLTIHAVDATQWHTVALEWTPDRLDLIRDGTVVTTVLDPPDDAVPDNAQVLAIGLDVHGDAPAAPVMLQIDEVTVEAYDPGGC